MHQYRNNETSASWCTLLLPFCLFPLVIKYNIDFYCLLFNICLCSCLISIGKDNEAYVAVKYILHVIFSIVPTVFQGNFSDAFLSLCMCSMGVWYCNFLVNSFIMKSPKSFTSTEAQIISQGIMLFAVHIAFAIYRENTYTEESTYLISQSASCLQVLLFGCLLLVHTLILIPMLRKGILFFCTCGVYSSIMLYIWSIKLKKDVFSWMLSFCLGNKTRVFLLSFWIISTIFSILIVIITNQRSKKASTIVRKYFHVVIVAVYIPGIIYDPELLRLASGIALTAFIVLEMFRILKIPIVGSAIENSFQVFLDEKDEGALILTHIYLLVGSSFPLWLLGHLFFKKFHISLLSGVISVGFGDTAAAIGGTLLGKHHWKNSKRTIEGSVCSLVVQLVVSFFFLSLGHELSLYNLLVLTSAVFLTTLLEAKTSQVDNLVLPLFMNAFLLWIQ